MPMSHLFPGLPYPLWFPRRKAGSSALTQASPPGILRGTDTEGPRGGHCTAFQNARPHTYLGTHLSALHDEVPSYLELPGDLFQAG